MVGVIFEEFLADPGLAKAHAIGDHDAIVAGQDLASLFHRVLLKFAQLNGRTNAGCAIRLAFQVIAEVLKDGFHVDLVGSVLFPSKFGGVDQVDQFLLEVAGRFPLPLVPCGQFMNG